MRISFVSRPAVVDGFPKDASSNGHSKVESRRELLVEGKVEEETRYYITRRAW